MYSSLRKQPIFGGLPLFSPRNDVWETSAEIPYWWRITPQIWVVLLIGQSETLPIFGYWRVISMEFLRSFLRRHLAGKPVVARQMSAVFSGSQVLQLHVISVGCLHGYKLAASKLFIWTREASRARRGVRVAKPPSMPVPRCRFTSRVPLACVLLTKSSKWGTFWQAILKINVSFLLPCRGSSKESVAVSPSSSPEKCKRNSADCSEQSS